MSSNKRLYIILAIIGLIILVFTFGLYEFRKVPNVEWKKDYQKENKDPYGTWLFYNMLQEYYPDAEFVEGIPPDQNENGNLFVRIAEIGSLQDAEIDSIEAFVRGGNTAIIISDMLGGKLDSLEPESLYKYQSWTQKFTINFENDSIRKVDGYSYEPKDIELEQSKSYNRFDQYHILYDDEEPIGIKDFLIAYSNNYYVQEEEEEEEEEESWSDTAEEVDEDDYVKDYEGHQNDSLEIQDQEAIPVQYWNDQDAYILVKNKIGDNGGSIYFCTLPEIFTNIALQQKPMANFNEDFFASTGVLPNIVYWDDSPGIYIPNVHSNESPLQYIMSQKSLKWAYYTTLISTLLFLIFRSKRRQKIIPLKEEKNNTSLEYIDTISKLYLSNENHQEMAIHLESIFYHKVESKYFIPKDHPNFVSVLAKKSRLNEDEITPLLQRFEEIKNGNPISTYQLRKITTRIENILQT